MSTELTPTKPEDQYRAINRCAQFRWIRLLLLFSMRTWDVMKKDFSVWYAMGLNWVKTVYIVLWPMYFSWKLIRSKDTFLNMGSWIVNSGEQTRFWEDKWLGNLAFKDKYPSLYAIVRRKGSSIASVMRSVPRNVSFRRALVGQNLIFWYELCASIVHIQLNHSSDCFRWNFNQNGRFSVRLMYLALINNGYIERNKMIWKLKMPLKIKIFMWYLLKGVVLTKDNLARRN